nr:DUF5753 domain-containing protein [Actinomadura rifamycini]
MQLLDDAWKTGGHFQRLLFFARTGHDPDWFKQYIQYEENASVIKIYDGKRVPALIQTEGYARALLASAGLEEAGEREAEARRHRREILKRRVIPYIWVLLDQEVLECLVGSPQIMREQLWHLIELSKHPRIVIRIVPREVGAHRGHDGAFQVQTVGTRDVAYVGAQIGGRLIEGGDEVRTLALWFDQIGACAWSKGASRELIERETRKYDDRVAQEFT